MQPALPPGFTLLAFDSIGSTNDEAKAQARAGAAEGTLVWAKTQEAGRGRRGRQWVSPPGNLYCSVIIRPDCSPIQAGQLSFVAAVAVAEAVASLLPSHHVPQVKWPNDVQVGGMKLAGILLEAESLEAETPQTEWLVIGVGVNVTAAPDDLPYPATALAALGAAAVNVEAVLGAYAERLAYWLQRWRADGFAPVRAAWLARCVGLHQPVTVRFPDSERSGIFAGIDENGALELDVGETALQKIAAGEVFLGERAGAGASCC